MELGLFGDDTVTVPAVPSNTASSPASNVVL
jgi:hypothetical protein